jgi:hypothetical protein
LWCHETGISRPQYKALLEILRMPELQQEVHKLPSCLSTLKRQTTSELPHDDDNDNDEDVLADPQHSAPNVTGCIAAKYCREVLSLPTRVSHLDSTFSGLLAKD